MTSKQRQALDEWQSRSPVVAWRGSRSQKDFAKLIGLKNHQLLQHWERGYIADGDRIKESCPPTKWLRAMLRVGISVDFVQLHTWLEARPKFKV